jgi:glucose-1-phosphate thymidylyltransferase
VKGVILAGGLGTRLYPLTHATNKHLLPVYDQPMIYYPIQTLLQTGIKDVLIITGGPHAGHFMNVLRNGEHFGLEKIEYAYQESGDGGIAQALSLAESFADDEPLTVILGDNCTDADISQAVKGFEEGAVIFLQEVSDPKRFGVPEFDNKEGEPIFDSAHGVKIVGIEEKPEHPKSNFAVTGLYIYDNQVFDLIRKIKPSARGQLEITDVNNLYIEQGKLRGELLHGFWSDAGTFESLFKTNEYWAKKKLKN